MADDGSAGEAEHERGDQELELAVESFVQWARDEGETSRIRGLPPLLTSPEIESGSVLGDYELVRKLGSGGMGVVWEARQASVLGRRVAVKLLRGAMGSESAAERFHREVRTVAKLDHPGIVPIVDAHVDGEFPFYVMKFVPGVSADHLIRKLKSGGTTTETTAAVRKLVGSAADATDDDSGSGSWSTGDSGWEESYVRWVARRGSQVADALQYASERGFVHRDVKSANVMVTPRGRPVLLDFGLASCVGDESLTETGDFLGTLAYAAPEQVRGEEVDIRGDVYSLGVCLYELIALRRPFAATKHGELLRQIETGEPAALDRSVPADLRTIVQCALSKSPERRYATPAALAHDLRQFLADRPIVARPPGVLRRSIAWVRRHPRTVAVAAVLLAAFSTPKLLDHRRAGAEVASGREAMAAIAASEATWRDLLDEHRRIWSLRPLDTKRLDVLNPQLESAADEIERGYRDAERKLRNAFLSVADYGPARRELANLYAANLRHGFEACDDVFRPERIEGIETALLAIDERGLHASLGNSLGTVQLDCDQPGAVVSIARDFAEGDDPIAYRAALPFSRRLKEGSYSARFEADGYASATLPFLVRRDACYTDASVRPPRERHVVLLRENQIPEGFVYISAGDTLVRDAPPAFQRVESFFAQRFEVTNAEFLSLLDRSSRAGHPLTFYGPTEGSDFVQPQAPGERWTQRAEMKPDQPVRNLSPMDMGGYAAELALFEPPRLAGHAIALPSDAQWTRMARGADARPYPWGSDSSRLSLQRPAPGRVGRDARDTSPFGVRDLSGSVSEATAGYLATQSGVYAIRGGAYDLSDADSKRIMTRRGRYNGAHPGLGFRLVHQLMPAWMRTPDLAPEPFLDDFERPDSPDVGNGWIEITGLPGAGPDDPQQSENSFIENGALVCQGGSRVFDAYKSAFHRVHLPPDRWTVRATIRATYDRSKPASFVEDRFFGLRLVEGFETSANARISFEASFRGGSRILIDSSAERVFQESEHPKEVTPELVFELIREENHFAGRIWPVGEERPLEPTLELSSVEPIPRIRYVEFTTTTFIGVRLVVTRLEAGG